MADDTEENIEEDSFTEDFDVEENEDGSATIIPKESEEIESDDDQFYENLAENKLDSAKLNAIATEYLEFIEIDKKAREKRDKQYAEAIQRSGLGDDAPGGAEFEGASRVVHPLVAEAAIDFMSAAIKELFPSDGPVRQKIEGKVTPEKLQKADRKKRHMNWQLKNQIIEFKPTLEQLLTQTSMGGVQYSKMYYWKRGRRPRFEFVPLDDVFVPFHATSFYSATRKTHRQRLNRIEFEERVNSGLYVDVELERIDDGVTSMQESAAQQANDKVEGKEDPQYDEDGLRTIYEVYCMMELTEDTLSSDEYKYCPYILTIDGLTEKVLAIYRNWDPEDETHTELDWLVEWPFIPWRGAYAIGLSHLIGGLSAAATGALRALLDSAHINNAPTALKLKGAQISGQSENISITQIHEIDGAPGVDDIKKIAMPLPFNPPSTVLFSLLGFLVEAGRGVVRTAIESNPDYSPNIAPGTQYSMIEQGMKVYSSIHGRLHDSLDRTLMILHRLNKNYLEGEAPEIPEDHATDLEDEYSTPLAYHTDYQGQIDVQPTSDPNIFSDSQRFAQMAAVGQLIDKAPDLYDRRAYHKSMLQLMKVPNIDQLLPEVQGTQDENPVAENIKMAVGQPAGVLPDQDHLAHLQVHLDFMLSPMYGENPAIKPHLVGPWVNHVMQHALMLYGSEVKDLIEKASGMKVKDFMSDDASVREALSKAAAAASPIAMRQAEGLLGQIMPIIQKNMQFLQSITPPPMQDPVQVAAQDVQVKRELGQAQIQQKAQSEQIKEQNKAREIAVKEQQVAQDAQEAQLKAQVELEKNEEDNQTALTIAAMRTAEGGSPGNLKNGNGLDQNFSNGGLVTSSNEEDNG